MTTSKYFISLFSVLLYTVFNLNAQQQEIKLMNPSFEDPSMDVEDAGKPMCCKVPRGWYGCGPSDISSPDAQPGNFKVTRPAADGGYYIGMVTRDIDTWESIAQRLRSPLQAGKCYSFSLTLSHSDELVSQSRRTLQDNVKYNKPAKVRIWAGNGYCQKLQLLDETPVIEHTDWKQYNFKFEPIRTFNYLTIEVFYKTPTPIPYNGNVLIDNASTIKLVPCDDELEPPVVEIEQPEVKEPVNVSPSQPKVDPQPKEKDPIVQVPQPKEDPKPLIPNDILGLDREKLVEGQVIRIEDLNFKADSSNISKDAYPVLNEIYAFLNAYRSVSIEIGGHTNNRCQTEFCDYLSEKRAKSVADYLVKKGIRSRRLLFRGYGKRNPVATNATPTGRKRNQRVEIKILNLDG